MLRKFLSGAALAALVACPAAFSAQPRTHQSQDQQKQTAQAQTVSGTVTAIGNDRKSFSLEVKDNSSSQTKNMQFYIDQKTQVQGRVGIGTKAQVQYQPSDDGRNLALNVTPLAGQ